ncbi:MAG: hypothetical protein PVJ08_05780 [Dehalococcoidia bacterium]
MTATEAYRILLQRQTNEDRILAERTSMFLLATSFLFAAFVVLLTSNAAGCIFTAFRILLPIIGIILTFLLYCFNKGGVRAVAFWHDAERKIKEEAKEFEYMRRNDITPHIAGREFIEGRKEWTRGQHYRLILVPVVKPKHWWQKRLSTRIIYRRYLPLTFFTLWLASLVMAIILAIVK